MDPDDIARRFNSHPADTERARTHEYIRGECLSLAWTLNETVPEGREKALAITNLEQVMFWANAAIARQDVPQ